MSNYGVDPIQMDCPACKSDGFDICNHTELEREFLRGVRAEKNRAKKKRQRANQRQAVRAAYMSGEKW